MKKKTMAFVMSLLMIVALVGVGFATWIITSTTTEEATGNVTVDTVVDVEIGITPTWKGTNSTIHFGAPAEQATPGAWLLNDSETKENLSVTLSLALTGLVVKNENSVYGLNDQGITISLSEITKPEEKGKYAAAVEAGYVAELPVDQTFYLCKQTDQYFLSTDSSDKEYNAGTDVAVTDGAATLEVTLTFEWGTEFGDKNPYTYFNEHDGKDAHKWTTKGSGDAHKFGDGATFQEGDTVTETFKEFSKTALTALEALNEAQFKATITATSGIVNLA